MKTRRLIASALLACAAVALTACGPDAPSSSAGSEPAAAPTGAQAGSAQPGTATATAKPTGTASKPAGADARACAGSEGHSDVTGEMLNLDGGANPRWTGVVKLTNVSGQPCVLYGAADLRTDHTSTFTKLKSGVLGTGTFATDKANGTVLQPGGSVYQPVTWLSSPPIAANATCTTGSQLVVVRNDEVLVVSVPVKDARFCPEKEDGSPQARIGVPTTTLAEAKAKLQGLGAR